MNRISMPSRRLNCGLPWQPEAGRGFEAEAVSWKSLNQMFQVEHESLVSLNDRVNLSLLPVGEKVADRPDQGAFVKGRVLKIAPHPSPLPQFFASILHFQQHVVSPQKTGQRG
jgi:hypothetical protein